MRMKSVVTGLRHRCVTSSVSPIPNLSTVQDDNDSNSEDDNVPLPNFVPDTESLDSSSEEDYVCITCNQSGGSLLVCTQTDCPVTVHVTCIAFKPHFDLSGNFFCPYCSYKRAFNNTRQLRLKAIRSKIALSNFLQNTNPQTLRSKDNVPVQPEPVQENQNHHVESEPVQMDKDNENHPVQPEQVQENENHSVQPEQVQENENHPVEQELSVQDCLNRDEPEVCADDSEIGEQHNDNDKGKDNDKGRISVSGGSVRESISESVNETKDPDFDVEEVLPNAKRKVASVKKSLLPKQKTAAADDGGGGGDDNVDEEEVTSTRRKPVRPIKIVTNPNLLTRKRRRLPWTSDEENAIKEGVLKQSTKNKNISWIQILEDGCSVFDNTRTPVDLKDKWKTMNSKKGAQNTKN